MCNSKQQPLADICIIKQSQSDSTHQKSIDDAEWQRAFHHTSIAAGNRNQHPLKTSCDGIVEFMSRDLRPLYEVGKNCRRPRLHDERILSHVRMLCYQMMLTGFIVFHLLVRMLC